MDIKSALNSILPINVRAKEAPQKAIKAENSSDRDANGQASYDQKKQKEKEPMSDEQYAQALKRLSELPAIKEHALVIEPISVDGKRFVILKEKEGKVLRRIPESELWTLPDMLDAKAKPKGQLLRKTA